ncbi:MAG: purine-binding chemotaxis protein CheW [Thiobacillus sp.]|nr:purine-binding chemotaxis protein CheW [Thiobacillus sp.]
MSQAIATTQGNLPALSGQAENAQYLTFSVAGEVFAIGILCIKEIIEYGQLTEIPMMPAFIRGVINLRGAVVPVIDLAVRFGRQPTLVARRTSIVILEVMDDNGKQDLGILVDAVHEVLEIPGKEIEPPPAFGAKIRTDFIRAMGKVNDKFVIILNIDRVLSVEEMAMLTEMGGGSAETAALAGN